MRLKDKKHLLGTGKGFLEEQKPHERYNLRSPHFRGFIELPQDFKKGARLWLVGWKTSKKDFLWLRVTTKKIRAEAIKRIIRERALDKAAHELGIKEKAEYEAGLWPKKEVRKPQPPKQPYELRRKDVI